MIIIKPSKPINGTETYRPW